MVEVFFDSDLHKKLHQILVSHGFSYLVSDKGRVGRLYCHTDQHLAVGLLDDDVDGNTTIESATRATNGTLQDTGDLIVEGDYTPAEWTRIMDAGPDVGAMLACELSILTQPEYLQARQTKHRSSA